MNIQKVVRKTIFICLLGLFSFLSTACNTPKWSLIWSGNTSGWMSYTLLYTSPVQNGLLANVFSKPQEIYYLEARETEVIATRKLELTENQQTITACLGFQEAWIVLGGGQILNIDLSSQVTKLISEVESFGNATGCLVANDGSILIYGPNWMARKSNDEWITSSLPENKLPSDATFDGEKLWLLYESGKIYRFDQGAWNLMGTLDVESQGHPLRFKVINDLAWIATYENLYHWDFTEVHQSAQLAINYNADNLHGFVGLGLDSDGEIWLMTVTKIWHGINGAFEEIDLPGGIQGIRSARLEKNWNRLYVASEKGVYCLNVSDIQRPCFTPPK
jgi:hypothetical protein